VVVLAVAALLQTMVALGILQALLHLKVVMAVMAVTLHPILEGVEAEEQLLLELTVVQLLAEMVAQAPPQLFLVVQSPMQVVEAVALIAVAQQVQVALAAVETAALLLVVTVLLLQVILEVVEAVRLQILQLHTQAVTAAQVLSSSSTHWVLLRS
jgi:hypothetical protein